MEQQFSLQMIRRYNKLRIVARDNVIRVLGDEEQIMAELKRIQKMRLRVLETQSTE